MAEGRVSTVRDGIAHVSSNGIPGIPIEFHTVYIYLDERKCSLPGCLGNNMTR